MDSITIAVLSVLILAIVVFASWLSYTHLSLRKRYLPIIEIDAAVANRRSDLEQCQSRLQGLTEEYNQKSQSLDVDYQAKRDVLQRLMGEIGLVEEDIEMASFGLYRPHFEFDSSEGYKEGLTKSRTAQKQMVRAKEAATCSTEWKVEGSRSEGRKMTNRGIKMILRAFNGECDAAIAKVKWNNVNTMEARIEKAFDALNTLGEPNTISLSWEYMELKIKEFHLAHEYAQKRNDEKEEQRQIREQMRDEEKAQKEIEKAIAEAEAEEKRYEKALGRARLEAGEEAKAEVDRLQGLLDEARAKKDRAVSRAQMTRSGHVYVISNVGSFGEDVYKVGLTRRLEPLERVRELGGASVSFPFTPPWSRTSPWHESRPRRPPDQPRQSEPLRETRFRNTRGAMRGYQCAGTQSSEFQIGACPNLRRCRA